MQPSFAGPARRGIITRQQPDGTEIKLQLLGDAFAHTYATPDGRIVQRDAYGFYRTQSGGKPETTTWGESKIGKIYEKVNFIVWRAKD